jgi:hypothetical protein
VSTPTLRRAPLAKRLLEPDMVATLLDKCFVTNGDTACSSAVENGISVVVEVAKVASKELDKDPSSVTMPKTPDPINNAPDSEAGQSRRKSTVAADSALGKILQRLEDLVMLLHKPPPMAVIVNSTGKLDPPLGIVRLKVLELIAMLVALDDPVVEERLATLKVLPAVLDIFFKYEWHNLLHNLVYKMLEPVIMAEVPSAQQLKRSLLEDGKLLSRIIQAHADNDEHVKQPKATRKGYMGQLRLLAVREIIFDLCTCWRTSVNVLGRRCCTAPDDPTAVKSKVTLDGCCRWRWSSRRNRTSLCASTLTKQSGSCF